MKYHRVFAEIDLDAIGANFNEIRKKVPDTAEIMAVVKADAYGHGAVAVAEYLHDKADRFGVASLEEALELRRAGVTKPVLILGYTSPEDYVTAVENGVTLSMFSLSDGEELSRQALSVNGTARVHIKVDTGMSRIGFPVTEKAADDVAKIASLPGICVEGVFSHYATADEDDKTGALKQKEQFDRFVSYCEKRGVVFSVKHISNSAATAELTSYYNMVRCGIILYGMYPAGKPIKDFPLVPAMKLCSKITFIKELEAGQGISYGHLFVTDKPMRIATVSLGYADGYPRALTGKGELLVRGKRCPIVGRICMDQMMIDVTDMPEVCVGDTVVAVGYDGEGILSAEEVSEKAGSFNYELVCGVSRRVPRIYFKNSKEYKTVTYIEN